MIRMRDDSTFRSWLSVVDDGVIIQGLTGRAARIHAGRMRAYGTPIVAGVVPGRSGEDADGVPIFDTVAAAVAATGAVTTLAFLPPSAAGDGLLESVASGVRLSVCLTEGVPSHDILPALGLARLTGARVIGPNSPGVLVPERFTLGFLPSHLSSRGSCAVIARSGTLSYEVVLLLTQAGVGQSAWFVVGGDRIKGATTSDAIKAVVADGETETVVLVGEIGGSDEEDAAELLQQLGIPAVALIAGRFAPSDREMGHAGAFIDGGSGAYATKIAALKSAGVSVVDRPSEIPSALRKMLIR
jgi:succinyl-CoA synthetase alpha subunit